ncbi:MAG: ABC transporter permease [Firmicutes bacterium]|nr:ABC transporter permease [Bacillota bacterium]
MRIKTFWYFAKEAWIGLGRNGLMTIATIVTITLSLIILGFFYIIIANGNYLLDAAKGVLELRVYLKDDADPYALQSKIIEYQGVKDVSFVSKEESAEWLEKNLGIQDLFKTMENPLPNTINIKLRDDAKVRTLAQKVAALEGVDEVEYGETFIEWMLIAVQIVWVLGIGLVTIVGIVVLYIIVNTIRITVFARRKEIEIMKLVGATDWFIRWPFLIEGIILGLIGAVIALLLLSKGYYLLLQYIKQFAPFIPLLTEQAINRQLFVITLGLGFSFGVIGSMLSLKKFLRV